MESKHYLSGAVGPFIDDRPLLTHATIKPYVIAILLHRGAVSFGEVLAALTPHCADIDLKIGLWDELENCHIADRNRLEVLVEEVLGEMVGIGILRYNEEQDIWVLSVGENRKNLPKIINWVSATEAQLPHHVLLEMSQDEIIRTNAAHAKIKHSPEPSARDGSKSVDESPSTPNARISV